MDFAARDRPKLKQPHTHNINKLELRGFLLALDRRIRPKRRPKRFLHLLDSEASLAIVCKGRTSSSSLLPVTCKVAARVLGGSLFPIHVCVKSKWNPADDPRRR